jgi:ribosomal protein S18 acetylase RimI-like enzyme
VETIRGLPKEHAASATEVFWDGFSFKFRKVLRDPIRAKKFLLRTFDPEAMVLVVDDSDVLGFLGVTDLDHPMQADEWAAARDTYGFFGALGKSLLLAPLEQKPPPGALHVEWIAVSKSARGKGVGSILMAEAEAIAHERGLQQLVLDVIDSNPRAQALYERLGYEVESNKSAWPVGWLYGFKRYTHMVKRLS